MKSKLRSLNLKEGQFKYLTQEKFIHEENAYWESILRVFRAGYKNTPLEIIFKAKSLYIAGNPLTAKTETYPNLHRPGLVRCLTEWGFQQGWDGLSKMKVSDGMSLLRYLGFDVKGIEV